MKLAAAESLQIMCFVGNEGCIQIHSGEIATIREMGPWLNVMDPAFHLHLRTDHIAEVWAVRKPTDKGHVTSLEAYGADGELIIQFFGKRLEGYAERPVWRALAHGKHSVQGLKDIVQMRDFLNEFLNPAIKTRSVIRRQFLRRNDDDRYLTLAPMGHTEVIA